MSKSLLRVGSFFKYSSRLVVNIQKTFKIINYRFEIFKNNNNTAIIIQKITKKVKLLLKFETMYEIISKLKDIT